MVSLSGDDVFEQHYARRREDPVINQLETCSDSRLGKESRAPAQQNGDDRRFHRVNQTLRE